MPKLSLRYVALHHTVDGTSPLTAPVYVCHHDEDCAALSAHVGHAIVRMAAFDQMAGPITQIARSYLITGAS